MTERAKKREQVEEIAKRFVGLNEEQKSYIVGYMNGVQEERARWQQEQERKHGLTAAGEGMRPVRDGGAFCPIFISLGDGDV